MNDSSTDAPVLLAKALSRSFTQASGAPLQVLRDVNMTIERGERIAIVGASGSGKTTLLQLLGGLDDPTEGEVSIEGRRISELGDTERGFLRNRRIGFVYQFHHLLPEFTALENVAMPLLVRRESPATARDAATAILDRVGLGDRLTHKPSELSGGERQRAAVARALVTQPALVLADEPTGNLDRGTGLKVFDLMLELNADAGTALVVVTHDPLIAGKMQRVMELRDKGLFEAESP